MSDAPTSSSPTTFDNVVKAVARVDTAPLPAFAPGQVLDLTYELVEKIGGGGMGIVYRARDHRLGRDVAVKTLLSTGGDGAPDLLRLFEREARATAQLLHPNIVTLHHVGEQNGHPYLVLELLQGETLATRLTRRGRLPDGEALTIIDAVLAAVAFAHDRGVLHRDLKPSNVFVTIDERIKVLDFGVALSLDTDPGPVTRAAGTPGYMAPEQQGGAAQDARTDVWAAALVLVECLLGRRPDEHAATRSLRELEISGALRRVLESALAADPDLRPASAHDLRTSLSRASGRSEPRRPRRDRIRLAALGLGALTLGAGVVYALDHTSSSTGVVTASEVNGRAWHVNYGELRLHVDDNGTAYGVYDQGEGIIVGTFGAGRFHGRWCQTPTREPPDHAGNVELHFIRGDGRILIDGRWTYGDGKAAEWQTDFYGVSLETAPSYKLEQRLQHHEPCPG